MKNIPIISVEQAAALIKDGDTMMVGGFGMTGHPVHIMHALAGLGTQNLTFIGNNVGEPGLGGGRLLRNGQIKKAIGSYFTSNPEAVAAAQSGAIAFELMPQGTLAEAIRAGGAGIGGFFTPSAAGTVIAKDKEVRQLNGVDQVFVAGLRANVAVIRAHKADTAGNLIYRMTERNFNPLMATAADAVIAEVDEIVPIGSIRPEEVVTPGCHVDYLVEAKLTPDMLGTSASVGASTRKVDDVRMAMARRALQELKRGDVVNLGIGIPTLVADLVTIDDGIILQTENGLLGVGPAPADGSGAMDYPVNAGKQPVTALPGASYFDSAASFGMIRGGHVDVAIMGGLQVDEAGNLANWAVPGKPLLGVGGAMDLASGARRLIILMTHVTDTGKPKIVPTCTLPLTAVHAVKLIITDLAVFEVHADGLHLTELMPGATLQQVKTNTTAQYGRTP